MLCWDYRGALLTGLTEGQSRTEWDKSPIISEYERKRNLYTATTDGQKRQKDPESEGSDEHEFTVLGNVFMEMMFWPKQSHLIRLYLYI